QLLPRNQRGDTETPTQITQMKHQQQDRTEIAKHMMASILANRSADYADEYRDADGNVAFAPYNVSPLTGIISEQGNRLVTTKWQLMARDALAATDALLQELEVQVQEPEGGAK